MTNCETWTAAQIRRLHDMVREARAQRRRICWSTIAMATNHTKASCIHKHRNQLDKERNRELRTETNAPIVARHVKQKPRGSAGQKPICLDHSISTSTSRLAVEAEIRNRISVQGLTAGLLGDPMPGRSALDQKRSQQGSIS